LAIKKLANEFLELFLDSRIMIIDRLGQFFENSVGFGWEWGRKRVARFHTPALEYLVDILFLRGGHCSSV
jgi:hypothetical protein